MSDLQVILATLANLERLAQGTHSFPPSLVQAEIDDWHDEMARAFGFEAAVIVDYTPTKENR